jgi:Asp-tRNA(Asn)/Glu-tRNA(Gln) amidotransferase A subunit family amidase
VKTPVTQPATPPADGLETTAWPIARLLNAFACGDLSPVTVTRAALDRIAHIDPHLHAFVTVSRDVALAQAKHAESAYRNGERAPLLGIPVSVKDTFPLAGVVTTFGSRVYREHHALEDSGVVRRLRVAGAVIVGKTNTAEFGQSATTVNELGPETTNAWDPAATAGGSSGGAATSVAAGMAVAAVGSDGGGSIRIPAAFSGLFGIKPTPGLCPDDGGLRAMTQFSSPGPLTHRVSDARTLLSVLSGAPYEAGRTKRNPLRFAWCPRPEGRPVDPLLAATVAGGVEALSSLGHRVEQAEPPLAGWEEIFGPLVVAEEHAERGVLLTHVPDLLTGYERATLEAGRHLDPAMVVRARAALARYRAHMRSFFGAYDFIVPPATAVTAFPAGQRPTVVDGEQVSWLWGAFPFAVPFNVAGLPAAALPCGLSATGMPVGLQIVGPPRGEAGLLDVCAELEAALAFDSTAALQRWEPPTLG